MIYTRYVDNERNGYVIYGFDKSAIRVWAPSRSWGCKSSLQTFLLNIHVFKRIEYCFLIILLGFK
jgi:hypothetical protein